ncbi:MAG: YHS domain protein [Rhodobacteraceae bacterium]|nr:YHS domain protein [Paracoccaceae bacterium]
MTFTRRSLLIAAAALAATPAMAAKDPVFTRWGNAIRGYDPVAYFTESRPVKGSGEFEAEWNGSTWRFASAANRDLFLTAPEAYAPQYGGYCAWAVANGYTASTAPEAWSIYDGKLYLNFSLGVRDQWSQDIPGNVARGDTNWPAVLE